ncbi:hypothetical protein Sm713_72880 [Streptomyces sp. TS71-3]|nr:hypothetical protein Sm713_72880 [Streptomyces sp. TS71-3]
MGCGQADAERTAAEPSPPDSERTSAPARQRADPDRGTSDRGTSTTYDVHAYQVCGTFLCLMEARILR